VTRRLSHPAGGGILLFLLLLGATPALAVRFAADGLRAGPASVYLTRTITVAVEVEDTSGHGADVMETGCVPVPEGLVTLVGASPPPAFTCTPGGRSAGRYGWQAVKEGVVRFRVTVGLLVCDTGESQNIEELTPPVTLMPVPMDTVLTALPQRVGFGDSIEIALTLHNRAPEFAVFGRPVADIEMIGRVAPPAVRTDGPVVEPAAVLEGEHMILPAGSTVRVRWHFRAIGPGEAVFRVVAAGLIMMTSPVTIRQSAVLDLSVPAPAAPSAVGRAFNVRAEVGVSGETGARDVAAALSWSPADAARLASASLSASVIEPGNRARAGFTLELLKAGPLMFTVSAGGLESDTGRRIEADPVTRLLAVQAPPDLNCVLELSATPVLAGSRLPLRIGVVNRSKHGTQGLTPLIEIREGAATVQPFMPLFQGVPPASTAWFAGGLIPDEAGSVEVLAQVTGRGDRGGDWITIPSEPVRFQCVARPTPLLFALPGDVWEGASSTVRFVIRNGGPDAVRFTSMAVALTASSGLSLPQVKPGPVPLNLASGASATLAFRVFLPATKAPYEVTGMFSGSGVVTSYRLPFSVRLPSRPLAGVRPRQTRINAVEPDDVFRPVADPLLSVDWSSTFTGELGLAVTTAEGRLVSVVRPLGPVKPGRYLDLWRGQADGGGWVAPGRYVLRLAGPSSSSGWPEGAPWRQDRPFQVAAP